MKTYSRLMNVVALCLAACLPVAAENWKNYANYTQVTGIAVRNSNEVWVSAKGGLMMYNKTSGEKTFFSKAPGQLPSLSVERVAVNALTNDIWIGTYDNGLAFFNNGSWTAVPFPERNTLLYEMKMAPDGAVWAATTRGVYCYKNGQFTAYLTVPNGSADQCWDIELMADGRLLCAHGTPFIFNPQTQQSTPIPSTAFAYGNSVVAIENDSTFYFADDHGTLARFVNGVETDTIHTQWRVTDILPGTTGKLLLTEGKQLLQWHNGTVAEWVSAATAPTAITKDADSFWIGDSHNFGKLILSGTQPQPLEVSLQRTGLTQNWVKQVVPAGDGNLLLIAGNAVQKFNVNTQTFTQSWLTANHFNNINTVLPLNGQLYAGTSLNYLYRFITSDSFEVLGSGVLPDNEVQCLDADAQGNLWLAGPGYIARYNGTGFTTYTVANNPNLTANLYVRHLHCDKTRNVVWAATYNGIFKIENGTVSFYNDQTPGIQQYYDPVNTISEDAQHNIWFGTVYGALIKYNGSTFSTMLLPQTAGNQFVTGIQFIGSYMYVSDNLNGIWVYHNNTWDSLNVHNTPLTDNYVTSIHADANNNLWITNLGYGLDVYNRTGVQVSVPEGNAPAALLVYPNPSNGVVRIQTGTTAPCEVSIAATDGRVVYTQHSYYSNSPVNLPALSAGIYIATVTINRQQHTLRIAVQ